MSVALHNRVVRRLYGWHERRFSFMVFDTKSSPVEGDAAQAESRRPTTDHHAPQQTLDPKSP